MTENDFDVAGLLRRRISEARDDLERLENALAIVEQSSDGGARRPVKEPAARGRRPKPVPTAAPVAVVPVGKLMDLLKSESQTTRQLARRTGGDSASIVVLLKEQEAAGRLRRTGQRAQTTWHVADDQEAQIRARAAEIAAQSAARQSASQV